MLTKQHLTTLGDGALISGPWFAALEEKPTLQDNATLPVVTTVPGERAVFTVLGSGDLPSIASDGQRCVVFDGVLYNHLELINDLQLAGDSSNGKIVLQAQSLWGKDFLSHIKGLFAFAIWDGKSLICVRDRLGGYPLFVAHMDNNTLLISTYIKTLHTYARLPVKPNRLALADHLVHRWPSKEETFYENIVRVPAGQMLRVEGQSRSLERYWTPFRPDGSIDWATEEEVGRFDSLLDESVRHFLEMGQTGIMLSGGLDSVSVAAALVQNAKIRHDPVPLALSLFFPAIAGDEVSVQRSVAKQLGLPHLTLDFDEGVGTDGLLIAGMSLSRQLSSPLLNGWTPAYYPLLSMGARQGAKILLTGEGGDEWLNVTPYLMADMMRSLDFRGMAWYTNYTIRSFKAIRIQRLFWDFGLKPILGQVRYWLTTEVLGLPPHQYQSSIPEWIAHDSELKRQLRDRAAVASVARRIKSFYEFELEPTLDHMLSSWEREETFELGAQLGVRIFHPYWEADMIDLLYRTPPKVLGAGGRSKSLVRASLARRFPDLGFERQKKVASTDFFAQTMLTQGERAWQKLGSLEALSDMKIIEPQVVNDMLHKILDKKDANNAWRIWDIFNLESWLRSHLS